MIQREQQKVSMVWTVVEKVRTYKDYVGRFIFSIPFNLYDKKCSERSKKILQKCFQSYSSQDYNRLVQNLQQLQQIPDHQKSSVVKLFFQQLKKIGQIVKQDQMLRNLVQCTTNSNIDRLEYYLKILINKKKHQNIPYLQNYDQLLQFANRCRYILITINFSMCQGLKTIFIGFDSFDSFSRYLYQKMNIKELYNQYHQFFEQQKDKDKQLISKKEIEVRISLNIIWLGQNVYRYVLSKVIGGGEFRIKDYDKSVSSSSGDQFYYQVLSKIIQILQTNEQFQKFIQEYSCKNYQKSGKKRSNKSKRPEQLQGLQKIIQQKDEQIQKLDKQIQKLNNQLKQKSNLIQKLKILIKQKQQQIKKLQKIIEQLRRQPNNPKQNNRIQQLQKTIQLLNQQLQQIKKRYRDLQDEFNKEKIIYNNNLSALQKQIKKLNKEKDSLQEDKQKLIQSLRKQQQKCADVFKQKLQVQKDLKDSKAEIDKLLKQLENAGQSKRDDILKDQQIKNLKQQISGLKQEIKKFNEQIKRLNQKNQELKNQKKQAQDKKIKYQQQITELIETKDQISKEKDAIQRLNKELEQKIKKVKEETKKQFERDLDDKKQQIIDLESKLKNQKDQNFGLMRQIQQFESIKKKQFQKLQKGVQNIKYKYNELDNQHIILIKENKVLKENSRSYAQYFNGDILNTHNADYTKWLVGLLEKMYKTIAKTNFLYKFDPQNPISFHKYIDEHPFIVILVRLKNGNIVGGFSEEPFKRQHSTENKPGFLFNLNKQQYFQLKDQKDTQDNVAPTPIIWNDYFIMFGNAELRIRFGQNFVSSNFGANAGYFDNKGLYVGEFLGKDAQNTKQADFITYELFSIVFEK